MGCGGSKSTAAEAPPQPKSKPAAKAVPKAVSEQKPAAPAADARLPEQKASVRKSAGAGEAPEPADPSGNSLPSEDDDGIEQPSVTEEIAAPEAGLPCTETPEVEQKRGSKESIQESPQPEQARHGSKDKREGSKSSRLSFGFSRSSGSKAKPGTGSKDPPAPQPEPETEQVQPKAKGPPPPPAPPLDEPTGQGGRAVRRGSAAILRPQDLQLTKAELNEGQLRALGVAPDEVKALMDVAEARRAHVDNIRPEPPSKEGRPSINSFNRSLQDERDWTEKLVAIRSSKKVSGKEAVDDHSWETVKSVADGVVPLESHAPSMTRPQPPTAPKAAGNSAAPKASPAPPAGPAPKVRRPSSPPASALSPHRAAALKSGARVEPGSPISSPPPAATTMKAPQKPQRPKPLAPGEKPPPPLVAPDKPERPKPEVPEESFKEKPPPPLVRPKPKQKQITAEPPDPKQTPVQISLGNAEASATERKAVSSPSSKPAIAAAGSPPSSDNAVARGGPKPTPQREEFSTAAVGVPSSELVVAAASTKSSANANTPVEGVLLPSLGVVVTFGDSKSLVALSSNQPVLPGAGANRLNAASESALAAELPVVGPVGSGGGGFARHQNRGHVKPSKPDTQVSEGEAKAAADGLRMAALAPPDPKGG